MGALIAELTSYGSCGSMLLVIACQAPWFRQRMIFAKRCCRYSIMATMLDKLSMDGSIVLSEPMTCATTNDFAPEMQWDSR